MKKCDCTSCDCPPDYGQIGGPGLDTEPITLDGEFDPKVGCGCTACDCEEAVTYGGIAEQKQTIYDAQNETAKAMRAFESGATRNVETDPDIHGFTSPLAIAMFARYMHENRLQKDGTYRDSDNWKRGIPLDSYIRSIRRHLQDLTLHHDGYADCAREDLYAALSGLFFNVQGYMHEVSRADIEEEREEELRESTAEAVAVAVARRTEGSTT